MMNDNEYQGVVLVGEGEVRDLQGIRLSHVRRLKRGQRQVPGLNATNPMYNLQAIVSRITWQRDGNGAVRTGKAGAMMHIPARLTQTRARLPLLEQTTSRRKFTRYALLSLFGAGVAAVVAACGGKSESAAVGGNVNIGSVNDVRASLASQQYVRSIEGRLFLLPATDNAVIAVSWKCTHMGCTLPPPSGKSGNFECPCHAAVFDSKTGIRLGGPANRPLDYMHAVVESGNVIVDTSQIFTRAAFEIGQTAPLA